MEGHLRGANWDGYTHNAKFNGRTVRNGIDVSYYQGSIDWNAVKNSGIDFVFVRVGYRGYSNGALKEDPNAAANINGALTAGLKVGVYMFSQAVNADEEMCIRDRVIRRTLVNLFRYRYRDIRLVTRAVEDYLRGPQWLMDVDAEQLHGELLRAGYRYSETFCGKLPDRAHTQLSLIHILLQWPQGFRQP